MTPPLLPQTTYACSSLLEETGSDKRAAYTCFRAKVSTCASLDAGARLRDPADLYWRVRGPHMRNSLTAGCLVLAGMAVGAQAPPPLVLPKAAPTVDQILSLKRA